MANRPGALVSKCHLTNKDDNLERTLVVTKRDEKSDEEKAFALVCHYRSMVSDEELDREDRKQLLEIVMYAKSCMEQNMDGFGEAFERCVKREAKRLKIPEEVLRNMTMEDFEQEMSKCSNGIGSQRGVLSTWEKCAQEILEFYPVENSNNSLDEESDKEISLDEEFDEDTAYESFRHNPRTLSDDEELDREDRKQLLETFLNLKSLMEQNMDVYGEAFERCVKMEAKRLKIPEEVLRNMTMKDIELHSSL